MKIYFATSIMVKLNNIFLVFILLSTKLSIVKKKTLLLMVIDRFKKIFRLWLYAIFILLFFFSKSKIQMSHLN